MPIYKMHTVKGNVMLKMQLTTGTGEAGVCAASMVGLTPCLSTYVSVIRRRGARRSRGIRAYVSAGHEQL